MRAERGTQLGAVRDEEPFEAMVERGELGLQLVAPLPRGPRLRIAGIAIEAQLGEVRPGRELPPHAVPRIEHRALRVGRGEAPSARSNSR